MSLRDARIKLSLTAALATLLAATPLSAVYASWRWFALGAVVVAVVTITAMLGRALRAPQWLQALATLGALLIAITALFSDGAALAWVVPTPDTFREFGNLVAQAALDTQRQTMPVRDSPGLLFLAVTGIGLVAVTVDAFAVNAGHSALAGLPMLAIYSVPVAASRQSVSWILFALGALGFLALLVVEHVEQVRQWGRWLPGSAAKRSRVAARPLVAAGARLSVVGILLAIIVPLALPGQTTGIIDRLTSAAESGTFGANNVGSGYVNPVALLRGNLVLPQPRTLITVNTDDPDPFYLRLAVADRLAADGFHPSDPAGRPLSEGLPNPSTQMTADIPRESHMASVRYVEYLDRYLPLYSHPTRVTAPGDWSLNEATGVATAKRAKVKGMTYSFAFDRPQYSAERLRAAPTLNGSDPYLVSTTSVPRNAMVDGLVAGLIRGKTSAYDRVLSILNFFSPDNRFVYTLEPKSGTSANAIEDFLIARRGYCEQYAAAMTWMVRAAGIPARVVVGFTKGTQTADGLYAITNHDLHAWSEVFFPGVGWVPFDPTPGVANSSSPEWAPRPEASAPSAPQQPSPDATQARPSATPGPIEAAGDTPANPAGNGTGRVGAVARVALAVGLGLALIGLLVSPALARLSRRRLRQRTISSGPAALAATAAWTEFTDTLMDLGHRVRPAQTPRAVATDVLTRWPLDEVPAAGLRYLVDRRIRAEYDRQPAKIGPLADALAAVRHALMTQSSLWARLTARCAPRSVRESWRTAWHRARSTTGVSLQRFTRSTLKVTRSGQTAP